MLRLDRLFAGVLVALTLAQSVRASAQKAPAQKASAPNAAPAAPAPPDKDYYLFVVSESADQLALVKYGPSGLKLVRDHKVGMMPTEINGPHGVAVSPDGKWYYVSIAHGTPYGTFWKFSTENDSIAGRTTLGNFPATVQTTPDGALAFIANFNVHGDMVPSSISVVSTDEMVEIARITTCTMPHGSRVNKAGTHQYSACMMDDALVEIDTRSLEVSRHFMLGKGKEMGMTGAPGAMSQHAHGGSMNHDSASMAMPSVQCSPTWAQPSASGDKIFVACNKSSEIVEIDFKTWQMTRRWAAGDGVYNLGVSPDGKLLLATNKRGKSISVFDIAAAKEIARIPTLKGVVHGVVVSPDSRYAFVTEEGRGSEPGIFEVFDLTTMKSVATLGLGQQTAGLDFFRTAAPSASQP